MSRNRFSPTLMVACLISVPWGIAGCRGDWGGARPRPLSVLRADPPLSRFGELGVDSATKTAYPLRDDVIRLTENDEELYVFNGTTGEPISGRQAAQQIRGADVVILGEMHTDPMAHRLQRRFVREALSRDSGTLSLEMMTREEQSTLARVQKSPASAELALQETSLKGWPRWNQFYLPVIHEALAQGRPVIAANAPRSYVTAARTYGYGYLRDLPGDRQRLFSLPEAKDDFPDYRRRVLEMAAAHPATQPATAPTTRPQRERMNAHVPDDAADQPAGRQTTRPATRRTGAIRPAATPATRRAYPERPANDPEAFYEAQLVWDATMANSILRARRHGRPIVHLVGSFHSDYEGGLTQMLRRRGMDVVTVSFVPVDSQRLRPEDEGRADIVIYTGADRPLPPQLAPATRSVRPPPRPATQPARIQQRRSMVPPMRPPATRPATRPAGRG